MRSIEFEKFIDLVTFDQNLVKLEHEIKKSRAVEQSLLAGLERLEEEFAHLSLLKTQNRKAVDEKELYMKVLDAKEAELKLKLAAISNQKEYKSLQKETLLINEQRISHEKELLALWNKLEAFEKNYEIAHKAHDEQVAISETQIQAIKNEIIGWEEQLAQLNTQRVEKECCVPQEWLAMYINMKGRVQNPVIAVVNESCDACFYSITPRDLQMLRQDKLLQCRECYRLLYIQESN